jgi:integrase
MSTTALYAYLTHPDVYGQSLMSASGNSPVWLSASKRNEREAIGPRTISNMCKEFLGSSKVHTTRHTAAVRMHHAGAKLSEIGRFLGHKNLKTTSDYMDEQLTYENKYASDLESEFGI